MRRYLPAFDYVDISQSGDPTPSPTRTTKDVPIDLFISVPDRTPAGELPQVIKADSYLEKMTLKQIKAFYKGQDSEWSAPKLQFISVLKQKYVVARIDSELVIAVDVYKIENGFIKKNLRGIIRFIYLNGGNVFVHDGEPILYAKNPKKSKNEKYYFSDMERQEDEGKNKKNRKYFFRFNGFGRRQFNLFWYGYL